MAGGWGPWQLDADHRIKTQRHCPRFEALKEIFLRVTFLHFFSRLKRNTTFRPLPSRTCTSAPGKGTYLLHSSGGVGVPWVRHAVRLRQRANNVKSLEAKPSADSTRSLKRTI